MRICPCEQAKVWFEESREGQTQVHPLARDSLQRAYSLARGDRQQAYPPS